MGLFSQPNIDKDAEVLKEEKEKQSSYNKDWSSIYWKPVPKSELRNDKEITEETGIRILLPPGNAPGAEWHMTFYKHFIQHPDGTEQFTCMKETYGEECVACNKYQEIMEEMQGVKDKATRDEIYNRARKYKPTRFGVFNVLGVKYTTNHTTGKMEREVDDTPKIFQSPISLWRKIIGIVAGRGRSSDIFDEFDAKGNVTKPGRDIIVKYDRDQAPANRYDAVPTDPVPLGTPEQVEQWVSQITPLTPDNPEKIAYRIDPEVVQIRTFGTKEEREQLKELLKEMWIEEQKAKEAEAEEAEPEPKPEPEKKETPAKKKPEPEKVEPKPEPEKPAEDKLSSIREKLNKIKGK